MPTIPASSVVSVANNNVIPTNTQIVPVMSQEQLQQLQAERNAQRQAHLNSISAQIHQQQETPKKWSVPFK